MEWKIGEIRQVNGEWYQCVEHANCCGCGFVGQGECHKGIRKYIGVCRSDERDDSKSVIFKELEKVGEPYSFGRKLMQPYKLYVNPVVPHELGYFVIYSADNRTIDIEIKQNQKDMKENKLNLKPFDIQKAKEGKPVCTRDGRKARIICFDAKRKDKRSIIALVPSKDYPGFEDLIAYPNNGNYYGGHENDGDLMMLSEKKEGWVNVYRKEQNRYVKGIFPSREIALNSISEKSREYIDTIKITWEE